MKLRIQFYKKGSVKYIGHLDTMRYFQRMLRRAGIDVSYSQGFSPHPVMSFAAPLGVGVESDSEIVDIEVDSLEAGDLMMDRMNEAGSPEIRIRDIRLLQDNAPNAMSSVCASSYTVKLRRYEVTLNEGEDKAPELTPDMVASVLGTDELYVTKKTKKGEAVVDIRPGIYDLKYIDRDTVFMLVDASSGGNIKPETVIDAMLGTEYEGFKADRYRCMITRNEIYGRDEGGRLLELIEFGERF